MKLLEASEKALPADYSPPHHLARILHKMKRDDEALVALARALPKAYGPRKGVLLDFEADVLESKGDAAGARAAVARLVLHLESLPPEQVKPEVLDKAKKRLADLDAKKKP